MREQLLKYLQSQRLISLATWDERPRVCVVYYVIDHNFNFYFVSKPDTQHCRDISKNPIVACAVYSSDQNVTDKKTGAQIEGVADMVSGAEAMERALQLWNVANPGFENVINLPNILKSVIQSRVYKVVSKKIKFFNEELYGTEGSEIFSFES